MSAFFSIYPTWGIEKYREHTGGGFSRGVLPYLLSRRGCFIFSWVMLLKNAYKPIWIKCNYSKLVILLRYFDTLIQRCIRIRSDFYVLALCRAATDNKIFSLLFYKMKITDVREGKIFKFSIFPSSHFKIITKIWIILYFRIVEKENHKIAYVQLIKQNSTQLQYTYGVISIKWHVNLKLTENEFFQKLKMMRILPRLVRFYKNENI